MRSLLQVTKFHRSCGSGTQPQSLTHTLTSTTNVRQGYDADGYVVLSYAGWYVKVLGLQTENPVGLASE